MFLKNNYVVYSEIAGFLLTITVPLVTINTIYYGVFVHGFYGEKNNQNMHNIMYLHSIITNYCIFR